MCSIVSVCDDVRFELGSGRLLLLRFCTRSLVMEEEAKQVLFEALYARRFHVCHQSNFTKSHLTHVTLGQSHPRNFSPSHSVVIW